MTAACWCGEPAAYLNEATDATPAHAACGAHLKDGYQHLGSLEFRVSLDRKPLNLHGERTVAETVIGLDADEWADFIEKPMASREWLEGVGTALIVGPNGGKVLVRTEGADYARYAARIA